MFVVKNIKKSRRSFGNGETKVGLLITKLSYYNEDKEKLIQSKKEKHQF
jgi:hypothetical protein